MQAFSINECKLNLKTHNESYIKIKLYFQPGAKEFFNILKPLNAIQCINKLTDRNLRTISFDKIFEEFNDRKNLSQYNKGYIHYKHIDYIY